MRYLNLQELEKDKTKYLNLLKHNLNKNIYNTFIKDNKYGLVESLFCSCRYATMEEQTDLIFIMFLDSFYYNPENKEQFYMENENNLELKGFLFKHFDKNIKLIYRNQNRLFNFMILFNSMIFNDKVKYSKYYNYLLYLAKNRKNLIDLKEDVLKYLTVQDQQYIRDVINAQSIYRKLKSQK